MPLVMLVHIKRRDPHLSACAQYLKEALKRKHLSEMGLRARLASVSTLNEQLQAEVRCDGVWIVVPKPKACELRGWREGLRFGICALLL